MLLEDLSGFLVKPTDSIRDVIATIDRNEMQIALVTDAGGVLLGTVTDGDIRRGLLRGVTLDRPAAEVMNADPKKADADQEPSAIEALMRRTGLWRIPVVTLDGRVVGLGVPDDQAVHSHDNLVVVMAGGLGTRLGELTKNTPKPLIRVGSRPILQTIVECFIHQGFQRFAFSVNYKAELIERYFRDGSDFGVSITYLHEDAPLGTAGALSLLEEVPAEPILVMNGDLLTRADFGKMLAFHQGDGFDATMAVREHATQLPFGVVEMDQQRVVRLVEKPVTRWFINAGIYVLEPSVLELIPRGERFDMTSLLQAVLSRGGSLGSFPVHEYWRDVGQPQDLMLADQDYAETFPLPEF